MKPAQSIAGIFCLAASISAVPAHALGLGEITLLSRLGEPLRAEVGLLASPDETPARLCFSLGEPASTDLPAIRQGKLRMIQRNQEYRLHIFSNKPVRDPVIVLNLRAGCGADLQREYVLTPEGTLDSRREERIETAIASSPQDAIAQPQPPAQPPKRKQRLARAGESLRSIAEQLESTDEGRARRLAALQRANPELDVDSALDEGTPIRVPKMPRIKPPEPAEVSVTAPQETREQAAQPSPPAAPAVPSRPATGDRLRLSAPDENVPAFNPQTPELVALEERMLRLETSLHLLRDELDKTDVSINQAASSLAQAPAKLPAAVTITQAQPAVGQNGEHWLEFLLSSLLGGALTLAGLIWYERRRKKT